MALRVPRDGFALAILVGGEDELVAVLQGALQIGDDLLFALRHDVLGGEVVVDIDGEPRLRQVTDVTDARLHVVVGTEEARDGLALRR